MGTTPTFGWPYPELTDPPDGPAQMKALGNAIDATVAARMGNSPAPLPYAMAAVVQSVNMNSTVVQTIALTFPAGRFTTTPIVAAAAIHAGNLYAPIVSSATATGVTAGARHCDNLASGANVGVHVIAIQMLTGAAPGLFTGSEDNATATCHTDGCSNAGLAIPIYRVDATTPAACGVCTNAITDVRSL